MFIYLAIPERVFIEDVSVLLEETPDDEHFVVMKVWEYFNNLCKNYISNGLEDVIYNVYSDFKTSTELRGPIEKIYKNYISNGLEDVIYNVYMILKLRHSYEEQLKRYMKLKMLD